jgi:hypothetical protein
MIKIIPSNIVSKYAKVRKADPKAVSRTHYLNFIREEQKFFDSSEKLEGYMSDWSLKSIPECWKALCHFVKMGVEKAKSVYYFQK